MQFSHPLMHDNFTKSDMNAAIKLFKQKSKILTQSKYVNLFEKKWWYRKSLTSSSFVLFVTPSQIFGVLFFSFFLEHLLLVFVLMVKYGLFSLFLAIWSLFFQDFWTSKAIFLEENGNIKNQSPLGVFYSTWLFSKCFW